MIGTAGWTVPRAVSDQFATTGSGLQRYASRFDAAEINTTFYRPHRPQTFERWAATVPDDFRFAVKVPQTITHEHGLTGAKALVERFLAEIAPLGAKRGPLLVQLPPSLDYDRSTANRFFTHLRRHAGGRIALEPRHSSWFAPEVQRLLRDHDVARVGADPARVAEAAEPAGTTALVYYRLHGSPRVYWSPYDEPYLTDLAARLRASTAKETWCIFDNTASGAAAANALTVAALLAQNPPLTPRASETRAGSRASAARRSR